MAVTTAVRYLSALTPAELDRFGEACRKQATTPAQAVDALIRDYAQLHNPADTRTVLVHLNVALPSDNDATVEQIVEEVSTALSMACDGDPALVFHYALVCVSLAEEV